MLLGGNEVDDGRAKPVNHRTHGSTLVIFARLWIYTPRFGMRKLEIAQVYYAEDEKQLQDSQIKTPARFI